MRITSSFVENKIDILNRLLGFEEAEYSTVGSVRLYHDMCGSKLHLIVNEYGGVTEITQSGTIRETLAAVQGMIAATRMAQGRLP